MNEAIALLPHDVGAAGLDSLLALVGFPSKRKAARDLSASIDQILNGVSSLLDDMLVRTIAAQTPAEFVKSRGDVFPNYVRAVTSLAAIVHAAVPESVIERVSNESFCEVESEFRDEGLTRFGPEARDQAMFTVWTLRRTSRLIAKIQSTGNPPKEQSETAAKFASDFVFYTTWTQFHLDCLLTAIRFDKTVQLAVLPQIIDGLRAAVNAYGFARQGLDIRVPGKNRNLLQWNGTRKTRSC